MTVIFSCFLIALLVVGIIVFVRRGYRPYLKERILWLLTVGYVSFQVILFWLLRIYLNRFSTLISIILIPFVFALYVKALEKAGFAMALDAGQKRDR